MNRMKTILCYPPRPGEGRAGPEGGKLSILCSTGLSLSSVWSSNEVSVRDVMIELTLVDGTIAVVAGVVVVVSLFFIERSGREEGVTVRALASPKTEGGS